ADHPDLHSFPTRRSSDLPALQKTLAGNPTLETRRRIEPLVAKLTGGILNAEQIRVVRAVEVVERIGTPEARQLLESLAQGAPGRSEEHTSELQSPCNLVC